MCGGGRGTHMCGVRKAGIIAPGRIVKVRATSARPLSQSPLPPPSPSHLFCFPFLARAPPRSPALPVCLIIYLIYLSSVPSPLRSFLSVFMASPFLLHTPSPSVGFSSLRIHGRLFFHLDIPPLSPYRGPVPLSPPPKLRRARNPVAR